MRDLIVRTDMFVQQGARLVGVLGEAITAAAAAATANAGGGGGGGGTAAREGQAGDEGGQHSRPAAPVVQRRTEQDLEEYLAGLPTMEALPLPLRHGHGQGKKGGDAEAHDMDVDAESGKQLKTEAVDGEVEQSNAGAA